MSGTISSAAHRVPRDRGELLVGQRAGLLQHPGGDAELADVVQHAGEVQRVDPLAAHPDGRGRSAPTPWPPARCGRGCSGPCLDRLDQRRDRALVRGCCSAYCANAQRATNSRREHQDAPTAADPGGVPTGRRAAARRGRSRRSRAPPRSMPPSTSRYGTALSRPPRPPRARSVDQHIATLASTIGTPTAAARLRRLAWCSPASPGRGERPRTPRPWPGRTSATLKRRTRRGARGRSSSSQEAPPTSIAAAGPSEHHGGELHDRVRSTCPTRRRRAGGP